MVSAKVEMVTPVVAAAAAAAFLSPANWHTTCPELACGVPMTMHSTFHSACDNA